MINITLLYCILNTRMLQPEVEMADGFRGEGKIYVVIAVILVILAGIFFTLVRMDRKLNLLEKEKRDKE